MDNLIDLFLYGCLIPAAVGALISHVLRKNRLRKDQERIKNLIEQIRAGLGGPL